MRVSGGPGRRELRDRARSLAQAGVHAEVEEQRVAEERMVTKERPVVELTLTVPIRSQGSTTTTTSRLEELRAKRRALEEKAKSRNDPTTSNTALSSALSTPTTPSVLDDESYTIRNLVLF